MSLRRVIQVAVEAVANNPEGYEESTMRLVLEHGESAGVSDLYLDLVRARLPKPGAVCNCEHASHIQASDGDAEYWPAEVVGTSHPMFAWRPSGLDATAPYVGPVCDECATTHKVATA